MKPAGPGSRRTLILAFMLAALCCAAEVGAQGFQRVILTPDASAAFGATAGDFDGDGDLDAATTNFYVGTALWIETLPGQPSIVHGMDLAYGSLRGLTAADFDNDGDVDMAVAAFDEDRFLWIENRRAQGADSFRTHTLREPANGAWGTLAADLNGDELSDLVTTEYVGNVVRIFLQENGALVETAAFSFPHPMSASVVDWDGDGDRDVVAGSYDHDIAWIEQSSSGWMFHSLGLGTGMANVSAVDLDGDGDADVVGAPLTNLQQPVSWWERTENGLTVHSLPGSVTSVRDVACADFDQDGDPDIVVSTQSGQLSWWQNNGNRSFSLHSIEGGSSLYDLCIVDFDQDGDQDVLVADLASSQLLLYRNTMGVSAILFGHVRSAADVPVANVMVRTLETGASTFTDSSGRYVLPVATGTYTLRTRHACWNDTLVDGVAAQSGDTTAVDFTLVRPVLDLDFTSLNVMSPNGQVTTVSLPVANTGDGAMRISASASGDLANDPWLTVAPDSVTVAPGDSFAFQVQIAPDTTESNSWDYSGLITLRTNACPDTHRDVAVVAFILDSPMRPELPNRVALGDIYPNPFNATATVRFVLPRPEAVTVRLFDVTGRLAQVLENRTFDAGEHVVRIDGSNMASGVYLVEMQAGDVRMTRKVLLLK